MCCKSGPTEASSNHIIVYPVLKKVHNFENTYLKTEMWWIIISQIWVCHIYIYCCLYEYKVNKLHWDSKIWETPLILSMILSNCDKVLSLCMTEMNEYCEYSSYSLRARYACTRYASCYSLLLVLGLSAIGKGENYLWQWKITQELVLHYKYLSHDIVYINNLRISVTDYPKSLYNPWFTTVDMVYSSLIQNCLLSWVQDTLLCRLRAYTLLQQCQF